MSNTVTGYLGKALPQGREVTSLGVLQPFVVVTATSASYVWQGELPSGPDAPATGELIIIANAENAGWVRVAIEAPVGAANYVPLYSKDVLGLEGIAIRDLHLLFELNADKIHLVYRQED